MTNYRDIIEAGEYDKYGIRAHRGIAVVGQHLGNSFVWVDGECTEEELRGICTIKIRTVEEAEAAIARARKEYCWDDETIVLVGGYEGEWGEDPGEYIIRDNVCLAIV